MKKPKTKPTKPIKQQFQRVRLPESKWKEIRKDYESSENPTLLSLTERHNIPLPTLIYHRDKEGWLRSDSPIGKTDTFRANLDIAVKSIIKELQSKIRSGSVISMRDITEWFSQNRSVLLKESQIQGFMLQKLIRDSITPAMIKKMKPNEKAKWFEILSMDIGKRYAEERLEEDKSTDNVEVVHRHILQLQKKEFEERDRALYQ